MCGEGPLQGEVLLLVQGLIRALIMPTLRTRVCWVSDRNLVTHGLGPGHCHALYPPAPEFGIGDQTPSVPAPSWTEASREPLMAGPGKGRDFTHRDSLPEQLPRVGKADPTFSRWPTHNGTLTYPLPPLPYATLHTSNSTIPAWWEHRPLSCAPGGLGPHIQAWLLTIHLVGELLQAELRNPSLSCTWLGRMISHLTELLWGRKWNDKYRV